ncbi:unnamed protein product [Candidula unifasciata]|uniref:Uncharacterized protein n=1 Tax=Candidula unifasciata TaxID=100452 RepID=A0A8S3ZP74_9EUPU|nr:unnamed protein product [Candidula unifasciata]
MDTLNLAKQTRQKEGLWEVEISHGGEADLHQHLIDCSKNRDHQRFIPVHKLGLHHFPAGCNDRDLLAFTQALADLTVRVSVSYISPERPKTFPGSKQPYPLCSHRGRKMTVVGTGRVTRLLRYSKEDGGDCECLCKECQSSTDKKRPFAHVDIETAAHVVYDRIEGENTTCHLFFDSGSQPDHCPGAVALVGAINVCSTIDEDWCKLTCVTHDTDLINKLEKMVNRWNGLWESLDTKYNKYVPVIWHKLTIIVSHPHGCSKQASIGYCVKRDMVDDRYIYTYSTATCPGSSGAPVFVLGVSRWWLSTDYVHSGVSGWNTKYNCSGYGSR